MLWLVEEVEVLWVVLVDWLVLLVEVEREVDVELVEVETELEVDDVEVLTLLLVELVEILVD